MPDASDLPDDVTDTGPRFRDFLESDVGEIVALGGQFFHESEFPSFATYAPEHFSRALHAAIHSPAHDGFVFEINGKIEGFLFYQLDNSYTEKPLALMWLFYVSPDYRKSPVGRELLGIAEDHARACGATAFYAGAMAGIQSVNQSLRNLYRKAGYDELFWARKTLEGTEDD